MFIYFKHSFYKLVEKERPLANGRNAPQGLVFFRGVSPITSSHPKLESKLLSFGPKLLSIPKGIATNGAIGRYYIGAPGLTTRNKDATRSQGHRYERSKDATYTRTSQLGPKLCPSPSGRL